ncbi:MAG TPA: hypothetical protein VLC08_04470, partial [Chitinolyticbacter sp.]|nr:hypothetical protein [Chitinolyticbacter sp.]
MYEKLNKLSESHGRIHLGKGVASGVFALMLGILCFLGVLAFHFPAYLTTPELREVYDTGVMRQLLFWSMVVSGGVALANILLGRVRWLSASAFIIVAVSALMGGHKVPVGNYAQHSAYIGLDWFILDLL